jgi:hypothetical protein
MKLLNLFNFLKSNQQPQPLNTEPMINQQLQSLNPKLMKIKKRVHAPNPKENILSILQRLDWPDVKYGFRSSWFTQNIVKPYHVSTHLLNALTDVNYIQKVDAGLYKRTSLKISQDVVENVMNERTKYHKKMRNKSLVDQQKESLLEFPKINPVPSNDFKLTQEEIEFIIAFRNLIQNNQTPKP